MSFARTAVVVGGSDGIGLASARALAASCDRVVLFARRPAQLEIAARELSGVTHVVQHAGDVRDAAAMESLAREYDDCAVLVVSGAGPASGDTSSLSDSAWEEGIRD